MMKKVISFLLSITLCSSMLTIFPAASWDLNVQKNQSNTQKASANNILQLPVEIQDLPGKYILQEKATDHPEYTAVYELLKKLDNSFREEEYLLSVNPYTNNGDELMIQLEYCIEGKIKTSKYYMLHYGNGEIFDMTGSFSKEVFRNTYYSQKEL